MCHREHYIYNLYIYNFGFTSWTKSLRPNGYIIFQYLAVYNIEKLPKNITILPKYVQNFAKHWIKSQPFDKD